MARNFMYVYERIYKEQNAMQAEFRKIPVKGKRTSAADVAYSEHNQRFQLPGGAGVPGNRELSSDAH